MNEEKIKKVLDDHDIEASDCPCGTKASGLTVETVQGLYKGIYCPDCGLNGRKHKNPIEALKRWNEVAEKGNPGTIYSY